MILLIINNYFSRSFCVYQYLNFLDIFLNSFYFLVMINFFWEGDKGCMQKRIRLLLGYKIDNIFQNVMCFYENDLEIVKFVEVN